jgi:transposase
MDGEWFVGIDVAKEWVDVYERPTGLTMRVANDPDGWATLVARYTAPPPTRIVLEATGGYEVGLVTQLDLAGLPPAVMNPLAIRRFAQSLGKRAKTDRLDAAVLAEYGERVRPEPRPVPTETARQLQEVIARHRQLTKMLVEEKNRRQQVTALVLPSVDAHIAWLEQQRAEVDRLLESVVASDPTWQERVRVLDSVPGIGALTATILAVGMPELGACSGSAAAALLGVAPHAQESGRRQGPRHVGGGRRLVRHAFYEAVMSTVRWDPVIGTHYRQLRDAGKPHKVALIACMRRLLGILNAMLRGGLTWQETDVGQGRFLTQPLDS